LSGFRGKSSKGKQKNPGGGGHWKNSKNKEDRKKEPGTPKIRGGVPVVEVVSKH